MITIGQESSILHVGEFVGVNDGIHNAEGQVKVLELNDSTNFLRLEDFKGPTDLIFMFTFQLTKVHLTLSILAG